MEPKETNVLETYGDRIKDTCQKILVNFKESLKFLKFDNIDRRRMARKDRIDRQMEEQEDETKQFSFEDELSKQNKLQLTLINIAKAIGELKEFNSVIREQALIELPSELQSSNHEQLSKEMLSIMARRRSDSRV